MNRTQGPERPFRDALQRLKAAGLRPTRQRLALTRILFENGHRHVTAETLHAEAKTAGVDVSLATIYNTLHQFTTVGLLREVVIDTGKAYFDTNTGRSSPLLLRGQRPPGRYPGGTTWPSPICPSPPKAWKWRGSMW